MSKNKVINFEPQDRLLEKAQQYIDSVENFLEELKAELEPLLSDPDIQVKQAALKALKNL